jgi:hypothetical protein
MKLLRIPLLINSLALSLACDREALEADIPAYVHIDALELRTNYVADGSASHKITTIWVEVNGKTIGAFELPATFPVIEKGPVSIRIDAGINENGMSATRTLYPFYTPFETTIDLQSLDTVTVTDDQGQTPFVEYRSFSTVEVLEDFDGVGLKMEISPKSDTLLYRTNDSTAIFQWGSEPNDFSGVAQLSDRDMLFEIRTEDELTNLPLGAPVFLELNYKCDLALVAGMYVNSASQGEIQAATARINPSEEWNKIYINLYSEVNGYPNVLGYRVFLGAINFEGRGPKTLYLDNIKLLY